MEKWLLLDDFNGHTIILSKCFASSKEDAQQGFINDGWVTGETISEADYLIELQQNALESISTEC